MSAQERKASPPPGQENDLLIDTNEGYKDDRGEPVSLTSPESLTLPQNVPAEADEHLQNPPKSEMTGEARNESQAVAKEPTESAEASTAMDSSTTTQSQQGSLSGQLEELSITADKTEPRPSSRHDVPPPPPEKDEAYLNPNIKTPLPSQSPVNFPIDWTEKELPEVPGSGELGKKREPNGERDRDRDDDSQSEIQTIMGQFADSSRNNGQDEFMSPRLELAEQFLGGPSHFPPRKSSLDPSKTTDIASLTSKPSATGPSSPSEAQHTPVSPILPKNSSQEEAALPRLSRRSSTSTIPPPPEPEPDQPFDFHRFLEQLRHRTADPVAKFLRSFLNEFGKRQWMVHEQVKIISDFLAFITNKMAQCEVWRDVSDSEFDNAKEGMEKLVMNRLYAQTFSPAIAPPPSIPRSASRSKRRELERLHGPWRRGQHQEDIERDEVLAQKIRIYSWVKEAHLDIPPVSPHGRRFLTLAQQELLKINGYRAPRDKVICILNCCKVIFGLLRNSKKADTSADSFVPLLIYVVLQANPDHLVSNIQYILRFRNQDKLGGEAGYYLSSLSGAIQFIETLDRTSLTVSDEEFERNVEAAVSAIAERNREAEFQERSRTDRPGPGTTSQATSRRSNEGQRDATRRDGPQFSDEDGAPVAGLLRTIQKPLSTIGRIFSDEPDSPQERPVAPVATPQPGAPPRLSPNVYQPPRNSGEERRSGERPRNTTQQQLARMLDTQDAAARQASAEDAEARRIQRAEHHDVVETLANMFPNLDRDVIDDVVKMKEGRVGLAVDACLALSAE